jgi:hypothetical protein
MPTQYYHIENYTCGNMKFISNVHTMQHTLVNTKKKNFTFLSIHGLLCLLHKKIALLTNPRNYLKKNIKAQ